MRIVERVAGRTRETLLALPPQWASYEEVEKNFQEAERIRLMYVAATRAGQRLIISQREKGQHYNPWKFFDKTISDAPVVPVPPRQEPLFREEVELAYSDVNRISGEAPHRWAAATALTYRTAAAKALALSAEDTAFRSAGEYGTEWGTVIHALLQAAMLDRDTDLIGLAKDALADQDLDTGLAQDAVEVVHSVMDSDIWRRAEASEHVLVEVPFETMMPETGSSDETARLLVRGTIDLAFREPSGWILVDYKTDRVPAAAAEQLVSRYNPQVQLYCQAWHAITGEPVHEAGLYFTHTRMYRTVT
jgi:ATP-dependent helicase/nuclease subunit A